MKWSESRFVPERVPEAFSFELLKVLYDFTVRQKVSRKTSTQWNFTFFTVKQHMIGFAMTVMTGQKTKELAMKLVLLLDYFGSITKKHTNKHTHTNKQTNQQTHTQTNKHTHTHKQTNEHTNKQTNR